MPENDLFTQTPEALSSDPDDIKLPNWREVNKAESARRQAEKALARVGRSGQGQFISLLQDVRRRHAGDPRTAAGPVHEQGQDHCRDRAPPRGQRENAI
jgi:hypothetical protein